MTLNEVVALLSRLSTAVQVTGVVAPAGKVLPEAGSQATGTGPSTRSAAVGAVQETTEPLGPSAGTLMSAGVPLMAAPSCRRR